jgi:hypothetical protein
VRLKEGTSIIDPDWLDDKCGKARRYKTLQIEAYVLTFTPSDPEAFTLVDVRRLLVISGEDSHSSCGVGVAIDDVLQEEPRATAHTSSTSRCHLLRHGQIAPMAHEMTGSSPLRWVISANEPGHDLPCHRGAKSLASMFIHELG